MKKINRSEVSRVSVLITIATVLLIALFSVRWSAAESNAVKPPPVVTAREEVDDVSAVEQVSVASATCSMNAAATPPDDHGRPADFGPSQAAPVGPAPSGSQVIGHARRIAGMFGRTAAAPAAAPAAARQMAFSEFRALAGWPDNPTINPRRCVWVVTVHAPMAVKVPPKVSARTVDLYSVVIDAASGTMIGLLQGRELVR